MVRIKMPLRLIEGEKHRNMTFMKRRVVIKKKVEELGTLCDIATMLVCYGPRGQLETWPGDPREVRAMIQRYRTVRPDDCIKRRYGLATFFEAHLKKLQADLARERESWLDAWSEGALQELARCLDAKLDAVEQRLSHLGLDEEAGTTRMPGEETPAAAAMAMPPSLAPPLAVGAVVWDVQPLQSLEAAVLDFSRVKREGDFRGHDHVVPSGSGDVFWEASGEYGLQTRTQPPPCALAAYPAARDPYNMLPMLPDAHQGFGMGADDVVTYVDDLAFDANRFLAADFAAYPAAAGAIAGASCTHSPAATAFPLSFNYDVASLGYGGGGGGGTGIVRNSEELMQLPAPFEYRPELDAAGYGFSLDRRAVGNTAVACHGGFFEQNELYGAEFVDPVVGGGGHPGSGTSLAWSGSAFVDLPPSFCSSSDRVPGMAVPGGDDSSKRVPSTATNPYT